MNQTIRLDTRKREGKYGEARIAPLRRGERNNVLLTVKVCANGQSYDLSGKTTSLVATTAAGKLVGPYPMEAAEAGIARIVLPAALYSAVGAFIGYIEIRDGETLVDTTDSFVGNVLDCIDADGEQAEEYTPLLGELQDAIAAARSSEVMGATAVTLDTGSPATAIFRDNIIEIGVPKGERGAKGERGEKGEQGDVGMTGQQGVQGPRGEVGPQGPQGIQGIQGPQGEKGDTGPQGAQGVKGKDGKTPVRGVDYWTEADRKPIEDATDNATIAANKAEAAVAQLPIPSGNVLKGEAESTMVSVHDAYPAPLVTTKVLGQSNQVTTTGKNLIKLDEAIKTSQGLELDIKSNGQLSINGTCTGGGLWLKIGTVDVVEGKTYYLSLNKPFPSFGISAWSDTDNKHVIFASSGQQVAKGVAAKTETLSIFVAGGSDTTFKNELVYVQIEEGQKTNWEPYTGGKPSPSPDYPQEITNLNKAEIVTVGKNLFSAQIDISLGNANEPIYLSKGTYTISVKNEVKWWKNTANDNNIYIHTFKENEFLTGVAFQNLVVGQRSYGTFNVNKNCEVRFFTYRSWSNNAVTEIQLEAGSKATTYEPHKSKSTPIDLKGNELCSLPNGVKDEVVIDAEGNVSLIKRITSTPVTSDIIQSAGEHENGQKYVTVVLNNCVRDEKPNVMCSTYISNIFTDSDKQIYIPSSMGAVITDSRFADRETAANILTAMNLTIFYQLAEPQIIPLGKVELPALPEATSNTWNNGNIPANVYINYLKDVNIAYSDLENQIKQITAALSVMDTPTVIPEI